MYWSRIGTRRHCLWPTKKRTYPCANKRACRIREYYNRKTCRCECRRTANRYYYTVNYYRKYYCDVYDIFKVAVSAPEPACTRYVQPVYPGAPKVTTERYTSPTTTSWPDNPGWTNNGVNTRQLGGTTLPSRNQGGTTLPEVGWDSMKTTAPRFTYRLGTSGFPGAWTSRHADTTTRPPWIRRNNRVTSQPPSGTRRYMRWSPFTSGVPRRSAAPSTRGPWMGYWTTSRHGYYTRRGSKTDNRKSDGGEGGKQGQRYETTRGIQRLSNKKIIDSNLLSYCGFEETDDNCNMFVKSNLPFATAKSPRFQWKANYIGSREYTAGPAYAPIGMGFLHCSGYDERYLRKKHPYSEIHGSRGIASVENTPTLESRRATIASEPLLSFYYHVFGDSGGGYQTKLIVSVVGPHKSEQVVWMSQVATGRRESNRWNHKTLSLSLLPGDKIVFKASIHFADISLDEVTIHYKPTSSSAFEFPLYNGFVEMKRNTSPLLEEEFFCGFENNSLCGMQVVDGYTPPSSSVKWQITSTPGLSEDTGANRPASGRYCLNIDCSHGLPFSESRLILPFVKSQGIYRITYKYHMWGFNSNQLGLYVQHGGNQRDKFQRLWILAPRILGERYKKKYRKWFSVILHANLENMDRLLFRGVKGKAYNGDIEIDDISVKFVR